MNVTRETPPTMLVQAEDDPVHVENAMYYWLALKEHAVFAELHLYPRGGHGYGRCTVAQSGANAVHYEVCTWPARAALFLQTRGAAPKSSTSMAGMLIV